MLCALLAHGLLGGSVAAAAPTGTGEEKGNGPAPAAPRFSHPRNIINPYLPLASLKQDILESKTGRVERTAKPEQHKKIKFGDQTVEALVVEDREYENGKLAEVTRDYFAQADDGTVYYLGEDVDEYKNGKVTGHSGAWLLGKDTLKPGVLMPAHPTIGQKFRSEDVPKITWEEDEVISVSETLTVPAGTYRNCVKIKETASDGATEYKYYAPGVGCVREVEEDAEFLLKSHQARDNPPGQTQTPEEPLRDALARSALGFVGEDPFAEAYWSRFFPQREAGH
jgi:hypothetical protein